MAGSGNGDALLHFCHHCNEHDLSEAEQWFGKNRFCNACYNGILQHNNVFIQSNDWSYAKECFPDANTWQLPWWAYDKGVGSMARSLQRDGFYEPLPLQCAVGPAVLMALGTSFATWGFFLVVPFAVGLTILCAPERMPPDDFASGIFAYKFGQVWSIVSPIFVAFLLVEVLCLRYCIVPMLQVTGGFKILCWGVSFYIWLPFNLLVSLVSHADLVTNGIFTYAVMHMQYCQPWGKWINCIWQTTMAESIFGRYIPRFVHVNPAFRHLAMTLCCLMFVQCIIGWIGSLPLPKVRRWAHQRGGCMQKAFDQLSSRRGWTGPIDDSFLPDYHMPSIVAAKLVLSQGPRYGMSYLTFWDRSPAHSDHGCALLSLADATRMCSITAMRNSYSQHKVRYYIRIGRAGPAFGSMMRQLRSTRYKLIWFGIIQSGIQLNLQVSLLSMTKLMETQAALTNGVGVGVAGIDLQLLFSVAIGLLNFWKNGIEVLFTDLWIAKSLKDEIWSKDINKPFRLQLMCNLARLRLSLFVYAMIGLYAAAKLVGLFECEQSMFNLTGCVSNLGCCFEDETTCVH